jgi:hypothetical protein
MQHLALTQLNARRWHAQDPCGGLDRQQARRGRA